MPAARPVRPLRLYRFPLSGHAHRVELFLSILGLPVELLDVDLPNGEHKQPAFLALNPLGQVPVLADGDLVLADSNAILIYLAMKYADAQWLPRDPEGAAKVQRFLSLAAGEIARGPAAARLVKVFGAPLDRDAAHAVATRLFAFLETHLSGQAYLAAPTPTIADIAAYSYIAHAPEGGISLEAYPELRAWLARVESLPGFVPMRATPLPAAA